MPRSDLEKTVSKANQADRKERRKAPRHKVRARAEIATDEGSLGCLIRDISVGGAQVSVSRGVVVPTEFRLNLGSAGQEVVDDCFVRWRSGCRVGVQFVPRHAARLPAEARLTA